MSIIRNRGVSLVAAMAIMLIVSALSVTMASMLGVTSRGALDTLRSSQALAIAQGGLNWYMRRLADTVNWTAEANQSNLPLGLGVFDLALSNQTATAMTVSVTGKISGTDGVTIQRAMSQRVWKFPSASKFALFWGRRTGSTLTLTSTTVNGNYWSQGTTAIPATSSVTNGTAYRPSTEDISGAGSYTEKSIYYPYFSGFSGATATFSTPAMDTSSYASLISSYNTYIAAATFPACTAPCTSCQGAVNQNANLALAGGEVRCYTSFTTNSTSNSNVTISGNGYIVANAGISLNTATTGSNRVLTISPSGGNIVLLAGNSLLINSASSSFPVTINSGTRMYSQSRGGSTAYYVGIMNNNTNINGALILANRRIIVTSSANLANSTLFVNYPGSTTNNYLRVTGSGTLVGTTASPCNLISIARLNATPSALSVDTSASVAGLLYQYDTANSGTTYLNSATIAGSVIANSFRSNAITSSTITYDPSAIPDPPLEGFNGFATKDPDSWTGN